MVEQLQAGGALDERAKAELVENLKKSDPAIWPQLMEYFRASLAMRSGAPGQSGDGSTASAEERGLQPVVHRRPAIGARRPVEAQAELDDAALVSASTSDSHVGNSSPARTAAQHAIGATVGQSKRDSPTLPNELAMAPEVARSQDPEIALGQPASSAKQLSKLRYAGDVTGASLEADAAEPHETLAPAGQSWRDHLGSAIAALEKDLDQTHGSSDQEHVQGALRLMYLIDGRRDEALRPLPDAAPAAREFWSKELYGMGAYLDAERTASAPRRATEAVVHLREAADKLAELANLRVKNLTVCTKVTGFGDYRRFDKYEFKAGQEVVLYGEVENFKSDASERGFHTALKCTVQILDRRGDRLADEQFRVSEDGRQNARHDFFLSCNFWLPKRLNPGKYTLQLSVEDELAQKTDQTSVDIVVRD